MGTKSKVAYITCITGTLPQVHHLTTGTRLTSCKLLQLASSPQVQGLSYLPICTCGVVRTCLHIVEKLPKVQSRSDIAFHLHFFYISFTFLLHFFHISFNYISEIFQKGPIGLKRNVSKQCFFKYFWKLSHARRETASIFIYDHGLRLS